MRKCWLKEIVFTVVLLLIGATSAAQAANVTVTNTNDSGAGSLRQAIISANAGDTVIFDSAVFASPQTINLTSVELSIGKNLTITGPGARLLTVQRATGVAAFRIFNITAGTVTISGMTISNGNNGGGGNGVINSGGTVTLNSVTVSGNNEAGAGTGAVRNSNGTTTILNSTINNNSGSGVGGVAVSAGTVNIANSTISGNTGTGAGGIGITSGALLNMNNVTVASNSTPSTNTTVGAGGVSNLSGATTNLRNTLISGNTASGAGVSPDVRGAFTSNGNNLIANDTGSTGFSAGLNDKLNVSANLSLLINNGGQTNTHKPGAGSQAIDTGNACVVTATCGTNNPPVALSNDQRGTGFSRPQGAGFDIGAIEAVGGPTAASVSISGRVLTSTGRGLMSATVTLTDSAGNVRTVLTSTFGYYRFTDVSAGGVVIVSVSSKKYSYEPRVLSVAEEIENLNFTAQ